jgi:hypothetical protein
MKIRRTLAISAVLMVGTPVLFSLIYFKAGSSWPLENSSVARTVETQSGVPEGFPSGNDLRQIDSRGPNDSIYIDDAIKKTLGDPDSFRFISATLWAEDLTSDGHKAWTCQAEYRARNRSGRYGLPEEAEIIFDAHGCRVFNPISEKKPIAMSDSERKTLMYTVKTIHDISNHE